MHASKANQGVDSLLSLGRQVFSTSREAGLHQLQWRLGKINRITPNVPAFSKLPQVYMLYRMLYGVECPFGQLGSAVLTETPPTCLCIPGILSGGLGWEKRPCLYKHCSAVTKRACAINTVSRTPPRHSPIPFTVKKITAVKARIFS